MEIQEFQKRRTDIISRMLDNPDKYGIYPTTQCFIELDDLYFEIIAISRENYMKQKNWNDSLDEYRKQKPNF